MGRKLEPPLEESLTGRRVGHALDLLKELGQVVPAPRGRQARQRRIDVLVDRLKDFTGGYPASASGRAGDAPGPRQVVVCNVHGVDVTDCHRAGHVDDRGKPVVCTGRPVVSADRVGDQVELDDRARRDLAEVEASVLELLHAVERLDQIRRAYEPAPVGSRLRTEVKDAPGCQWCKEAGFHEDVHTTTRFETVWATPLAVPIKVCSSCYRFGRDRRRRPSNEELRYRHGRGQGRWPAKRVEPRGADKKRRRAGRRAS